MPRPLGVPPSEPPAIEGTVRLADGRRLGFAEFGRPDGPLVLWFHGTPGARRQFPSVGRRAAEDLGLRVVSVERPGVGSSTDHAYPVLTAWAADVAQVADQLGHKRFVVLALSGGGPYALACAHELPERVVAVGLLGSLVPTAGDDAIAGGLVALSARFNAALTALRRPLGRALWGLVQVLNPAAHVAYRSFARVMPDGDRRVLLDRDLEGIFVDDLTVASRRQFQAFVNDLVLIGRPWGFRLCDVRVPVRWWHGDSDPFVPLDQAQRAAALLPDVELAVRPEESHLGDFAAVDDALVVLARLCHDGDDRRSAPS